MVNIYKNDLLQTNQLCLVINAGSLNEIGIKKGVAHILEHVILMGIKNRITDCKGYVDFSEIVISFRIDASCKNGLVEMIDAVDYIFSGQIVTNSRIAKAKIQIIYEIIRKLQYTKKQKKILQKLFESKLLEMPIGNMCKVFATTPKEVLNFYESFVLKENVQFLVIGKDAELLQEKLEEHLRYTKIIIEKNEIYISITENTNQKLLCNDLLKNFLFICMEFYFYDFYRLDIHIEMLRIVSNKTYLVLINRSSPDQKTLLRALNNIKKGDIPEHILLSAKQKLETYKGKVFDNDLIINALIDRVMNRGNAFYIQNPNYGEIDWKVLFSDTGKLIKEIFSTVYLSQYNP